MSKESISGQERCEKLKEAALPPINVYLIDVKCVAPENYRPRTSIYKGVGFSMHKNIGDKLKEKAIDIVKKSLSEQNPGVPLKFSASISMRTNTFCIDIDDEMKGIGKIRIPLDIKENSK